MDSKKPSMGRQKIKIAKIQVKNHLQVTFSKRRSGLMKKASELCTLCGVEIAIIVFSPAGKVFPFGHPSVDAIIDRFLTNPSPSENSCSALSFVEAHRKASIRELNLQLTQLLNELEAEKKKSEVFDVMKKTNRRLLCYINNNWWEETPISELGFLELEQLKNSMEELKKAVAQEANNKLIMNHNQTVNYNNSSSSSSSIFTLNITGATAGGLYHDSSHGGYQKFP